MKGRKVFLSQSASQTQKFAKVILKKLMAKKVKTAKILALVGELGSGKTTFVQGIAKALGVKGRITAICD